MKRLLAITLLVACAALLPAAGASAAAPDKQRVIAQLNLANGATPEQIVAITDELLAQLPADSYDVNNRYTTLPYVALSAEPSALSILRQSDLVAGVYSDGVVTAAKTKKKCKHGKHVKKSCKKKASTKNKVS
jgi:hypothetical protein